MVGEKCRLKVIKSGIYSDLSYTWKSTKKSVATVDKNGVIKGVKPGSTKITVKTANGLKAVCKVTVCKGEVKYEDYDYTSYNEIVRIKAYKGKD